MSVTAFFADKPRAPLGITFLPIVTKPPKKSACSSSTTSSQAKPPALAWSKKEDASIHQYVTGKLLGGPYLVVGKEEMKILRDPVGTGSAILKNVFGPMK